ANERIALSHRQGDLIAWPVEIVQTHRDGRPRSDTARDSNVNLIQGRIARGLAEVENLRCPAPNRDLGRNYRSVDQAGSIDFERLTRSGRIVGRDQMMGRGV